MSPTTAEPSPDDSAQPDDIVELGQGRKAMSPRSRLVASAALIMAVVVGVAVAIAGRGASPDDTAVPSQPSTSVTGSATETPSEPTEPVSGPATVRPALPAGIEGLPAGRFAAVPYWADGQLHFRRTTVPWARTPSALAALGGHAVVAGLRGRLVEVSRTGERRVIALDSTKVIAVDQNRQRLFYTHATGGDLYEIVAWDLLSGAAEARHTFEDTDVCCDQSYAVIRGVLPDGSVILDNLTWVRVWDPAEDSFGDYPLSGASAVRALSVGGDRLLVRDEHHSVTGIELRTTGEPLAAGDRLRFANAGLLSPDGRLLAVFSGVRKPFVMLTRNLGHRVGLAGVGSSAAVVNVMWDTRRSLLLQVETAGLKGDTTLVRCRALTGRCTRIPGDNPGAHQLPDSSGITY